MTADGSQGELRADAEVAAETDDGGVGAAGVASLVVTGVAWIVGVGLIVLGLLAVTDVGVAALIYLVPGVLVTPRTRREVKELAAIWVGK